jgi:hypothetical protein
VVASVDTTNSAFTVTLHGAEHFTPQNGTVNVTTSNATHYLATGQGAATFANVTATSKVVVVGTFDPASNTIAARAVIVLPPNSND